MPDKTRRSADRTTIDSFGNPYQSNGSSSVRAFDENIGHNSEGLIQHLFVNPGQPVIIRSAFQSGEETTRWKEDRARHSILVTVDHEPVTIDVEVWSADRSELREELSGVGISYGLENEVDVYDITIPDEHFTPGRTHEVTVHDSYMSDSRGGHEGRSQRTSVHYGGFELPPYHLCSKAPLNDEPTAWERWADVSRYSPLLFPVGRDEPIGAAEPAIVLAAPGATQTVRLSFFRPRHVKESGETLSVYFVALNGRPVAGPFWQRFGSFESIARLVDARHEIEFDLPTEPGVYDLSVLATMEPWKFHWTMSGEPVEPYFRNFNSSVSIGNTVRYVVGSQSPEGSD